MDSIKYNPRIIMECAACGYQKRYQMVNWEEVIRYKSGKRKGEIKDINEHAKDIFEDDPDFVPLMIGNDAMEFTISNSSLTYRYGSHNKPITVYACPRCGTLKVDPGDL